MALVLFGNGVADMRGSINGTTFARNKSGAYARNRTVPVNPNTVSQSNNRARFASASAEWTNLTAAERDSWNNLAIGATRLNRLGQSYTPSGRQLFLETVNNFSLLALPFNATAPLNADIPAPPDQTGMDFVAVAGAWTTARITGGSVISGMDMVVRITPPNPGPKTNFTNMYRNLGPVSYAVPTIILPEYTALFGTVAGTIGTPVSALISLLDTATGFRSAEVRIDTVVT